MTCAAVVLCAGEGARLGGRAKAALELPDGRTFVRAIAEAARAGGCTRVVAVVAAPHADEASRAAAPVVDALVVNPAPERGMISSIVQGLAALAGADAALVWPVDTPLVRPSTVAALVASDGPIVIPRHAGRNGHPTLFRQAVWAALRTAPHARAVIAADPTGVTFVDVDDPGIQLDVDTPEDYARLCEACR